MKMKVMTVTPTMASEWLQKNKRNRKVVAAAVRAYSGEIQSNRWMLTHQGIAFDDKGNLIDGQHRLMAIVETGKPIEMAVFTDVPSCSTRGLSMNTMDAIDRGRFRSIGQQLQIGHGIENANAVAAWCRSVAMTYVPSASTPTIGQTIALIKLFRGSLDALLSISNSTRLNAIIAGPCLAVHQIDPGETEAFVEDFLEHQTVRARTAGLLRKWMEAHPGYARNANAARTVALTALFHHIKRTNLVRLCPNTSAIDWLLESHKDNARKVYEIVAGADSGGAGAERKA